MIFRNTLGEEFTLDSMVERMYLFADEKPNEPYRIIIGTDSQHTASETVFVTAIIIHRVGTVAKFFYTRKSVKGDLDIYTRIMQETTDSLEIIKKIENSEVIHQVGRDNVEIHIDAGENGKSKKIMEACIAYVKGMGFRFKVKPESFGASHVADRYTK